MKQETALRRRRSWAIVRYYERHKDERDEILGFHMEGQPITLEDVAILAREYRRCVPRTRRFPCLTVWLSEP